MNKIQPQIRAVGAKILAILSAVAALQGVLSPEQLEAIHPSAPMYFSIAGVLGLAVTRAVFDVSETVAKVKRLRKGGRR